MRPVSGGLKVMTEANRKAEFHTHCVHSSTTATFIFNIFIYFFSQFTTLFIYKFSAGVTINPDGECSPHFSGPS